MKKHILLFCFLLPGIISIAQDVKYKKIFYKDQSIENMDVKITVTDAVATPTGLKFRLTITNKSLDYILFKPAECEFRIKGNNVKPSEKPLLIRPNDKDFLVLDIKGAQNMIAEDFKFLMDGIYRVSLAGKTISAANFPLPASANDFKAGGFNFTLDKFKKETASSWVKFKVSYNGDNIGIIEPNKISMKMPDGKEFANYNNDKPLILEKGKTDDFAAGWKEVPLASGDMQLVPLDIQFNDAFKETVPVKIPQLELIVMFDLELSNEKGK